MEIFVDWNWDVFALSFVITFVVGLFVARWIGWL